MMAPTAWLIHWHALHGLNSNDRRFKMKKIRFIILLCCLIQVASGQVRGPYTVKISRILHQLPANNRQQLDSLMQQIQFLGAAGLEEMTMMLQSPVNNDNTKVYYALSGYAVYVSAASREDERKKAIQVWGRTLKLLAEPGHKLFLITQLQLCGDETAVAILKPYLLNSIYCDAAARALVHIDVPETRIALEAALEKAKGACEIILVKSLGELRYLGAEGAIMARTSSPDPLLRSAALFALANIASADSEPVLAAAAEKVQFRYESSGATAAYLLYVANLGHNWPTAPAMAAANKIIRKCKGDSLLHVRIAALKIIADILGEDATPTLTAAAFGRDTAYGLAAVRFAAMKMNAANAEIWAEKAGRVQGKIRVAIIDMLTESKQRVVLPLITEALKDQHSEVRMAAIIAAGKMQSNEMASPLLVAMKTADTTETKAIGNALLCLRSREITGSVAVAMQHLPPFAQITLLQVLAERRAADKERFIRNLVSSPDPLVAATAKATLEAVTH